MVQRYNEFTFYVVLVFIFGFVFFFTCKLWIGAVRGGIMRVHVKRVLCSSCVCTQRYICVHYGQGVVQGDNECSCKVNIVFYFCVPLVFVFSNVFACTMSRGGGPGGIMSVHVKWYVGEPAGIHCWRGKSDALEPTSSSPLPSWNATEIQTEIQI